MTKKLADYLSAGLKAEFDMAVETFNHPQNTSKRGKILPNLYHILDDMKFYATQGVPLTADYLNQVQSKIESLRNSWSI